MTGLIPEEPVLAPPVDPSPCAAAGGPDLGDVRGQQAAKRALDVAAASGHNILMIGPPGSGTTMLAKRLPGILPPLSCEEALQTTKIHSVAGLLPSGTGLLRMRPFRAPHHTISDARLVGGGSSVPRPSEVSLAHNGLLFLDELPEFPRNVLEVLRQPLEDGQVTIARTGLMLSFPGVVYARCSYESVSERVVTARYRLIGHGTMLSPALPTPPNPLTNGLTLRGTSIVILCLACSSKPNRNQRAILPSRREGGASEFYRSHGEPDTYRRLCLGVVARVPYV